MHDAETRVIEKEKQNLEIRNTMAESNRKK